MLSMASNLKGESSPLGFPSEFLVSLILKNRPVYENAREDLHEKLEKVGKMKLEMYRLLQKSINDAKEHMELYLSHQESFAKRSEFKALRWKRVKELAEDIEIALDDFTNEAFDKKKLKIRVRELQAKRKEDENAYKIKWNEALETVKRYRNRPAKSVFDATQKLTRSNKWTSAKLQKAITLQKLYFQPRDLNWIRDKKIEDAKNVDADLSALQKYTTGI